MAGNQKKVEDEVQARGDASDDQLRAGAIKDHQYLKEDPVQKENSHSQEEEPKSIPSGREVEPEEVAQYGSGQDPAANHERDGKAARGLESPLRQPLHRAQIVAGDSRQPRLVGRMQGDANGQDQEADPVRRLEDSDLCLTQKHRDKNDIGRPDERAQQA